MKGTFGDGKIVQKNVTLETRIQKEKVKVGAGDEIKGKEQKREFKNCEHNGIRKSEVLKMLYSD